MPDQRVAEWHAQEACVASAVTDTPPFPRCPSLQAAEQINQNDFHLRSIENKLFLISTFCTLADSELISSTTQAI